MIALSLPAPEHARLDPQARIRASLTRAIPRDRGLRSFPGVLQ